jgi:hypothetical protein
MRSSFNWLTMKCSIKVTGSEPYSTGIQTLCRQLSRLGQTTARYTPNAVFLHVSRCVFIVKTSLQYTHFIYTCISTLVSLPSFLLECFIKQPMPEHVHQSKLILDRYLKTFLNCAITTFQSLTFTRHFLKCSSECAVL